MNALRKTNVSRPPSIDVGPVIVLHEHYQLAGSPVSEAGPAAIIHRGPYTPADVTRESLLLAATRATWSLPGGRSGADGYPCPVVLHTAEDTPAYVAAWEPAKSLIKDERWRDYAAKSVWWVKCTEAAHFGRAINLSMDSGRDVIFVATLARYFPNADLSQLAEQWLGATFGRGAIYTAPVCGIDRQGRSV